VLVDVGFQFTQRCGEALRDWLYKARRLCRRTRCHQETVALKIVGPDQRIKRGPHEPAAARPIQPNILVTRKRGAKIQLRDGIEPHCLEQRSRAPVACLHHQFDQRANIRRRITYLGRARQGTTCMSTNEIIDNLEGQVCARQGSVRKIHARLNKRKKRKTASGLGVQSRSEVGWIVSEASRVVCPRVADALVGRQPSEGLERLGKIIRFQEGGEVFYELPVGVVVIFPDSGVFDRAVHSFDLAVRPWLGLVRRCSMACSRQMRSRAPTVTGYQCEPVSVETRTRLRP
jgi:uncharacterized protein (DUF2147 family)